MDTGFKNYRTKKFNRKIINTFSVGLMCICLCFLLVYNKQNIDMGLRIYNYKSIAENYQTIKNTQGISELTKINSDFYAWIECEDVEISLPVVKTTNSEQEDFYLEHDFEKYKNPLGVPYQKYNCSIETTTNSVFVGHSTYDMHWYNKLSQLHIFGNFLNYLTTNNQSDFNYIIKVQTLSKTYTYKIISAYNYSTTDFNYEQTLPYTTGNISSASQFDTFYNTITKLSKINTQTTAQYGDNFLTIYTCSKNDMKSRVIVVAKLIETI